METISRKNKIHIGFGLLYCLFFLGVIGTFLFRYFSNRYLPGTWINGIYCGGLTKQTVSDMLIRDLDIPSVTVYGEDGSEWTYQLEDCDFSYSFDYVLDDYLGKQDFLSSFKVFFPTDKQQWEPVINVDYNKLTEAFSKSDLVKASLSNERIYEIKYDEDKGFWLRDEPARQINLNQASKKLSDSVASGVYTIELGPDYYEEVALTAEQAELVRLWEKMESYLCCDLVYDMGAEQIVFDKSVMSSSFVLENGLPVLDENGDFVLKENWTDGFIDALCDAYDTYGKPREFMATRGELVTIEGGIYGTQINRTKEKEFLKAAMENPKYFDGVEDVHIPVYKKEGYVRGLDDIGPNFIEVDMKQQKLYCHIEGEIVLTTDVVTGNMGRGWDTPEGTNYVYFMQRNRVLIGANYRTPVKYWMAVVNHIGIHDADWRTEFGGDIYITSGSHGCINIPQEIMPQIYELYEEGTPVLMFYD